MLLIKSSADLSLKSALIMLIFYYKFVQKFEKSKHTVW